MTTPGQLQFDGFLTMMAEHPGLHILPKKNRKPKKTGPGARPGPSTRGTTPQPKDSGGGAAATAGAPEIDNDDAALPPPTCDDTVLALWHGDLLDAFNCASPPGGDKADAEARRARAEEGTPYDGYFPAVKTRPTPSVARHLDHRGAAARGGPASP